MKRIIVLFTAMAVFVTAVMRPAGMVYAKSNEAPDAKYVTVVLDPGHGGHDGGACKKWGGKSYMEKDLNLAIAKACKSELETYAGVKVYLTRSSDYYVTLGGRVNLATNKKADLFVALHNNASTSSSVNGACVYYPNSGYRAKCGLDGQKAAKSIQKQLTDLGLRNKGTLIRNSGNGSRYPGGTRADYYYVIKHSKYAGYPGLIVEHAFISNAGDCARFLSSNEKLKRLGKADAKGIADYLKLAKKDTPFMYEPELNEDGSVCLVWDEMDCAAYYRVYRRERDCEKYICIAKNVTETTYDDKEVQKGTEYEYAVCGCYCGYLKTAFSVLSDAVEIIIPEEGENPQIPTEPQNPQESTETPQPEETQEIEKEDNPA